MYKGTANIVHLTGNLGQDPEVRQVGENQVANVNLATTRPGKNGDQTDWHRLAIWGKSAQTFADLCEKGSKVQIMGEVNYQTYEKDGEKRFATNIFVRSWLLLSNGREQPSHEELNEPDDYDDDIPF